MIMSDDSTVRWVLPLLQPGQAQKEMVHNEAIAALDLLVQPAVLAIADSPPEDREPGQCWIVGNSPEGDWAGRAAHLAGWTEGGWRYFAPESGMTAWLIPNALVARFQGDSWTVGEQVAACVVIDGEQVVGARRPAIADPAGGSVIDAESRSALASLLAAIRSHGLIAT
jgi:Protein of unknown function (DUF2793)